VAEDTAQCRSSLHNITFQLSSWATSTVKTHGGPHTPAVSIPYNPAISSGGSLVFSPRCAHRTVWSQCVCLLSVMAANTVMSPHDLEGSRPVMLVI
jgi:hypothetical protein